MKAYLDRLSELRGLARDLRIPLAAPFELPECNVRLDMAVRRSDPIRQFKYLHQMSSIHAENLVRANQLKLVSLLDGYLVVVDGNNPLGIYLFARTLLELTAFVYDVAQRLKLIAAKPDAQWQSTGEECFRLLIRARFATTDPRKRRALQATGVSPSTLKPLNIMKGITKLSGLAGFGHIVDQYDVYCDFVHHNLSSQATTIKKVTIASSAVHPSGGAILMKEEGPVVRYEYPLVERAEKAMADTIDEVIQCGRACVEWLNDCPRTPFSMKHLELMTGTSLGFSKRKDEYSP